MFNFIKCEDFFELDFYFSNLLVGPMNIFERKMVKEEDKESYYKFSIDPEPEFWLILKKIFVVNPISIHMVVRLINEVLELLEVYYLIVWRKEVLLLVQVWIYIRRIKKR